MFPLKSHFVCKLSYCESLDGRPQVLYFNCNFSVVWVAHDFVEFASFSPETIGNGFEASASQKSLRLSLTNLAFSVSGSTPLLFRYPFTTSLIPKRHYKKIRRTMANMFVDRVHELEIGRNFRVG